MFIGHFALGFAAKKAAPAVSLGTLFLAAQFIDLLWPTLLLLGIERVEIDPGNTVVTPLNFVHYPVSHSLVAVALWACALAALYMLIRRSVRGAVVIGLLVISHWILDFVTHRPDLPIVPGGATVGLGLWNSLPGTLVVEFGLFAVGVWLYLRTTIARNRTGTWALWGLVGFLVVMHLGNLFGPPPPGVEAIAWAGHAMWLLVAWGYWVDRNRLVRQTGLHDEVEFATPPRPTG
jgi:hypothetical protein